MFVEPLMFAFVCELIDLHLFQLNNIQKMKSSFSIHLLINRVRLSNTHYFNLNLAIPQSIKKE